MEGVSFRVTNGVRKFFEGVSFDMVTVLLWVKQIFPNLMFFIPFFKRMDGWLF